MKLVVGLGNPGPQYETTRHNVGFLAIDRLVERWKATGPTTKNQGEVYQTSIHGENVLLIKPQTYMNLSGRTVGPLFQFYKCEPEDLIVIYDEMDLPNMALKLKTAGGTAGHNGLKSIDQALGAGKTGYHKIRIGIGKGLLPSGHKMSGGDYVLQQMTDDELNRLDPLLDRIGEAIELIIQGDMKTAMNRYNKSEPREE